MRAWVAVTDKDWYRFLAQRPHLDEVNFWQPGGSREFRTLTPGEPFLFKLHYPDNAIVGGGFFTHPSVLPVSVAWEAFGEKNGADSYDEMRRRIERYRRVPTDPRAQYSVGCIILQEPFFFAEADWLPAPADFRAQTVQGKTYDLNEPIGHKLWQMVLERWRGVRPTGVAEPSRPEIPLDWRVRPVRQRLGQGAFRVLVTDVLSATVCDYRREGVAGAPGGAHSPGSARWAAPNRQWPPAPLGSACSLRSGLCDGDIRPPSPCERASQG